MKLDYFLPESFAKFIEVHQSDEWNKQWNFVLEEINSRFLIQADCDISEEQLKKINLQRRALNDFIELLITTEDTTNEYAE